MSGTTTATFFCCLITAGCGRLGFDPREANPDGQPSTTDAMFVTGNDCETGADTHTVALYQFNDLSQPMADAMGEHPGVIVGSPQLVTSQPGCGSALSFPGQQTSYGEIPHDGAWDLAVGSVDLWFRVDTLPFGHAGLVSRDASSTNDSGHFVMVLSSSGGVQVRIQREGDASSQGTVCSSEAASVMPGAWVHVGVNFGPPIAELWLNGVNMNAPGNTVAGTCQTGHDGGIAGNANSWVLGASTRTTPVGGTPNRPFAGAIDHFRISSVRRDFSEFQP